MTATAVVDELTSVPGAPANSILFVNGSNQIDGDAGFEFNEGTQVATVPAVAVTDLTASGVLYAGAAGRLTTEAAFTYTAASDLLTVGTIGLGGFAAYLTAAAVGVVAVKNGANAQKLYVYGTTTGNKLLSLGHDGTQANISTMTTEGAGTNTPIRMRSGAGIEWYFSGSGTQKANMDRDQLIGSLTCAMYLQSVGVTANDVLGLYRASCTATSGTTGSVALGGASFSDGGTNSSTVVYAVEIAPTFNYTGATRTGNVNCLRIAPVNTSLPTGLNAAISLASTAAVGLGGVRMYGTADEATNYVQLHQYMSATTALFDVVGAGTQVNAGIYQLLMNGNTVIQADFSGGARRLGFYGATPTILQTGVAVDAESIHAALVNLGLITA